MPPGFRILAFDSVGSTNEVARDAAREGATGDTVVWARRQEAGRGRRGRAWSSPEGNLYASVIVRPRADPAVAAQLSFAVALAVADVAVSVLPAGVPVHCKWPNDVLVDGRKVAGILLESEAGPHGLVDWQVVGVGVNLRHFPADSEYPATALAAEGAVDLDVDGALARFLGRFDHWRSVWMAGGFAAVRTAWLARAMGLGGLVRVRLADRTVSGTFADLDTDGVLLLDPIDGGARQRIAAGDVFLPVAGTR
jgi:BirA family biotin operon repressor/biotin-[acetyl-CoA-carboxylase] ligase